jgi:hypothetical protein
MKDRSAAIELVKRILWETWDPIGVNDSPEAQSEYDSYAPQVLGLLQQYSKKRDDQEGVYLLNRLREYLLELETKSMGLSGSRGATIPETIRQLTISIGN